MLKKTLMAAGLGLTIAGGAQADYRFEVDGGYSTGNIETGNVDIDRDVGNLAGTFFLDSVDTSKGPLGEAAFLDRASSVSLGGSYGELDGDAGDADVYSFGLDTRLVFGGFIVEAGASREETDDLTIGGEEADDDIKIDLYNVGLGYYIFENTTVVASFSNADLEDGGDQDRYDLDVEHMWLFGEGGIKFNLGYGVLDVEDADDVDLYKAGAAYYINRNASVGIDYTLADGNEVEPEAWSFFVEMFFTENIAASLAITQIEDDDFDDSDADALTLGVTARF